MTLNIILGVLALCFLLLSIAIFIYFWKKYNFRNEEIANLKAQKAVFDSKTEENNSKFKELEKNISVLINEKEKLVTDNNLFQIEIGKLDEKVKSRDKELATNKLAENYFEKLTKDVEVKFSDVSQKILEDRSNKNMEQIKTSLEPFNSNVSSLKSFINDIRDKSIEERSRLESKISNLDTEARKLSTALTKNPKIQGNWGELHFQNLLNLTNLTETVDYEVQKHVVDEDNKSNYLDYIIKIPTQDNKQRKLIVDCKVSLPSFIDYQNAETEAAKKKAADSFMESIRKHINGLSKKAYETKDPDSEDFVIMYIPFENIIDLILKYDKNLITEAYNKKVILQTPNSILIILNYVVNIINTSGQLRNANKIQKAGEDIYNDIVKIINSVSDMGTNIEKIRKNHSDLTSAIDGPRGFKKHLNSLEELKIKGKKEIKSKKFKNSDAYTIDIQEAKEVESESDSDNEDKN